jgi:hypothetical protein
VTINIASSSLSATAPVIKQPSADLATLPDVGNSAVMKFECYPVELRGECVLSGDTKKGDNPNGCMLGFIQVMHIETDWAYYRGQSPEGGSMFFNYGAHTKGCRDTKYPKSLFTLTNSSSFTTIPSNLRVTKNIFKIPMSVYMTDKPQRTRVVAVRNKKTAMPNYLREVQIELHFCTVLALLDASKKLHYLKSMFWNVHWQAEFELVNSIQLKKNSSWRIKNGTARNNSANVGKAIDGLPSEPKLRQLITAAPGSIPNCNRQSNATALMVNATRREESSDWRSFDVTR